MEKPHVFICMGRSGSGKGTQITLLQKHLALNYQDVPQKLYVCGDAFRNFFKKETPLSETVKDSVNKGNYQPDFFATTLFFADMFDTLSCTNHSFMDGYPRSLRQLEDLKELLVYVGYEKAVVINIDVTSDEVIKRMLLRGRSDDTEEGATKRQKEFDTAVVPTLEKIQSDSYFNYVKVDGMGTPEEVHKNVLQALENIQ